MVHCLTLAELDRLAHSTPGNEALADLLLQLRKHQTTHQTTLRVDLDKLLRKPDETKGSLPPL